MSQLQDKVAIVTGAGQGIGKAIALSFAKAGAKVAVNDINPTRATTVVNEITNAGGKAIAVMGDVGNKFQCVHIIETTREQWGQIDILVNNAGVQPKSTILKLDEWDWDRCFEVNVKGTFFMSQLVGRVMSWENEGKGGNIINIASTAGVHEPLEGSAAYCAAKAAVVGFAKECAREYANYGIRVNTILPGIIDTPSAQLQYRETSLEDATSKLPIARVGLAEEVAQTALFLASDASSYLTGITIPVDGGKSMR